MVKKFLVKVNGREYVVEVEELESKGDLAHSAPPSHAPHVQRGETVGQRESKVKPAIEKAAGGEGPVLDSQRDAERTSVVGHTIVAPMSGVILKVLVSPGQRVEHGQKVVILEAMKMENDIVADRPGVVKSVKVREGENVDTGQVLLELE